MDIEMTENIKPNELKVHDSKDKFIAADYKSIEKNNKLRDARRNLLAKEGMIDKVRDYIFGKIDENPLQEIYK